MAETTSRARTPLYDYLRLAAIAAVVLIHVLAPALTHKTGIGAEGATRVFERLLHAAVPLFVFLSGALVWGDKRRLGVRGYGTFAARRLLAVGLPYLAWSALYFALKPAVGSELSAFGAPLAKEFVRALIGGKAWYHLYFVPMILVMYALTPLARAAARRSPEALVGGALAMRVLLGPAIVAAFAPLPGYWVLKPLLENVVVYLPHAAFGAWFAYRREALAAIPAPAWALPFASGAVLATPLTTGSIRALGPFAERIHGAGAWWLLILGLSGLFGLAAGRNARLDAAVERAGSLAYGAYLAHPLVLLAMSRFLPPIPPTFAGIALDYAVALAATFGLVALLRRIPLAKALV